MRTTLYWIPVPWPGRLAIMPRPRGGDWLEDEVRSWRMAGVDVVVSLLENDEVADLQLESERELCLQNEVEYIAFPVPDRGVPSSFKTTTELVRRLEGLLSSGQNVAIHCRQGIGRSALLATCLLVASGLDVAVAFVKVQESRG